MLIAPLAWNLLSSGAVSTAAAAFAHGHPAANLFDEDPLKVAVWRGQFYVQAGVNDDVDFTEAGPAVRAGVVAPGVYPSPQEYWAAVAAAMNGAGGSTDYRAYIVQGSADRYRGEIANPSIGFTLDINSGPGAATGTLSLLGGFRDEDRASLNTHTADFAAIHGPTTGDSIAFDLTTAQLAHGAFVAGLQASPLACIEIKAGTTTGVADATERFAVAHDSEVQALVFGSPLAYRYVQARIYDSTGEEVPQVAAGYLYYGPLWDSDSLVEADHHDYEIASYRRRLDMRMQAGVDIGGRPVIAEVRPGQRLSLAFGQGPGLGSGAPQLDALLEVMGHNSYAFIVVDVDEHRETMLCRVVGDPAWVRSDIESKAGRWSVALECEAAGIL